MLGIVALALLFLINNYLIFWHGWPGPLGYLAHYGWLHIIELDAPLTGKYLGFGWFQFLMYLLVLAFVVHYVLRTAQQSLRIDADRLTAFSAFIIRGAFWGVVLIGLVDMLISFLRVEGFLEAWVGTDLNKQLRRPKFRGAYVHYPLLGLAYVIALFTRSLSFVWLALLVVLAEFQIVITRFIFSYEQAFMGDLVRFWYASLFLFASSYALISEGHVRVDVFYAGFSERGKARTNVFGSLLLGLPLCWIILLQGMWGKSNSINSPLLSYEISQSGYGMYIKYIMAGFLIIFALSMIIQFCSFVLENAATLLGDNKEKEPEDNLPTPDETIVAALLGEPKRVA